jgi:hypothetical protein
MRLVAACYSSHVLTVDPFRDSDGAACLRCRRCRALYRLDGPVGGPAQMRPFVDAHQDCTREFDAWQEVLPAAQRSGHVPGAA